MAPQLSQIEFVRLNFFPDSNCDIDNQQNDKSNNQPDNKLNNNTGDIFSKTVQVICIV